MRGALGAEYAGDAYRKADQDSQPPPQPRKGGRSSVTFSYDEEVDVMYVRFAKPSSRATYLENSNGDILRFDEASGQIVGVTIPCFMERMTKDKSLSIPEIGSTPFGSEFQKLLNSRAIHVKDREKVRH